MKSKSNMKTAFVSLLSLSSFVTATMNWAPMAYAADSASIEVVKLDPSLNYKEAQDSERKAECDSFMAEVMVKFKDHGLSSIAMENAQGPNVLTIGRTNAIFTSDSFERMVFLKTGVKLSDESAVGKLLQMKNGVFGYHNVTKGGIPYALIYTGFSEKEALEATRAAVLAANAPIHSPSYVAQVMNSMIPSANAESGVSCALPASGSSKAVSLTAESVKDISAAITNDLMGTAAKGIMDCAVSAITGALFATKVGGGVGLAMMAGAGGALAWEGAKALVTNWSGSVAKVSDSVQKTSAVIANVYNEIKTDAMKTSKKGWEALLAKPDLAVEFVCGIFGGLQKTALKKMLDGAVEATGVGSLVGKMVKSEKFAKLFGKKGAETAVASTAAADAGKAEKATTAAKAADKASDVAPAAETAQVDFAASPELKKTLSASGVSEPAPVLDAVSKVSHGGELSTDDRLNLMSALRKMPPEKQEAFAQQVYKVAGNGSALPTTNTLASKLGREGKASSFAPKKSIKFELEKEFKHAQRGVQVGSDPTLYPSFHKLKLAGKEQDEVIDVIVAAEERGVPAAKIDKAVEEAGVACKAK